MSEYSVRLQRLFESLPEWGAKRLESLLDRVYAGYSVDLRTPFADKRDRRSLLEELESKVGYTEYEELTKIEKHEKEKVGSYSICPPSEKRISSLQKYWDQYFNPDEGAYSRAVSRVLSLLPRRSVRPMALATAFLSRTKRTNSGLPWVENTDYHIRDYYSRASHVRSPEDWYPCIWFSRLTSQGLDKPPKARDVWGFDKMDGLVGGTILHPVLDCLKMLPGFAGWRGPEYVDEEATSIIRMSKGRKILSGDTSAFDSSLPIEVQQSVDDILCSWFVASAETLIRILGEVCATVGIVVPYDVLEDRHGGIASGHILTGLKGTLGNLICVFYVGERLKTSVERFMVLGDDYVSLFSGDWDEDAVSQYMGELGLEANPTKQFISDHSIHYLQRWHSSEYVVGELYPGVHTPYRSATGFYGYEVFPNWPEKKKPYLDAMRLMGQVEVCNNHPNHRAIVQYARDGSDILRSGMDPGEIARRAGGAAEVKRHLKVASYPFNVKDPESFETWKTVQVLRELRRS